MTSCNSTIDPVTAVIARWKEKIWEFDALEIHPCAVIGRDSSGAQIAEQCRAEEADFWTAFGHYRTGGIDDFHDFATEAEALRFHDRLIAIFPHLADKEG